MEINFKRISNLDEAKKWWEYFSPKTYLYDEWDFRYCVYKYFKNELFFYVGHKDTTPIGLLPLQYNTESKALEAFGGFFMRQNRVFIDPEFQEAIPYFFQQLPHKSFISKLIGNDSFTTQLPVDYYLYTLDISSFKSHGDFLETKLNSKRRTDLKRQVKLTLQQGTPEIVIDHPQALETLITLNKKMFKEESSFNKPFRSEIFHDFLQLPFSFQLTSFVYEEIVAAVALSLNYKDTYTLMNVGIDRDKFSHFNTYVTLSMMDDAIIKGAKIFDAGLDDSGWKENWNFTKIPEHVFEK